MRILIKIGGAQLEDAQRRAELAHSVAAAKDAGHELVIVHGGGNQIRGLSAQLGIADRYHAGLRVTDAPTADVVLMVLAGAVNKELVRSLCAAGVPACGLSGADGGLFSAKQYKPHGADLGYVGEVHRVRPEVVDTLLAGGFVPVLATVAPLDGEATGDDDHLYNINADQAAAPLARAFGADALIFLTDVPGVLEDGECIPALDLGACSELRARDVIAGGMLPKVEAALAAAAANPDALVKIAPAAGESAVLDALDARVGTRFQAQGALHG